MFGIYRRSHQVLAFVGAEENDSAYLLRLITAATSSAGVGEMTFESLYDLYRRYLITYRDKRLLRALGHFVKRSWFFRIWIRQEIAARAAYAQLLCGSAMVPWVYFSALLYAVRRTSYLDISTILQQDSPFLSDSPLDIDPALDVLYATTRPTSYKMLKWTNGRAMCADPRDKIYAVIGLLSNSDMEAGVVVDYRLSVEEVYTQVACALVEHSRSLDFLCQCYNEPGRLAVASWVPDRAPSREYPVHDLKEAPDILRIFPEQVFVDKSLCSTPRLQIVGLRCDTLKDIIHFSGLQSTGRDKLDNFQRNLQNLFPT